MAETKYIFVTGGVVSSLGKGIISSSIGKLLQARGYNITIQKFDPYINIDPGTLNPYEHGECYVTVDGMETDLDLGHYERFTGIQTTKANSMTTGRIYKSVIDKERRGDYLGKTIQVLALIQWGYETQGCMPSLVVAPTSLVYNWQAEIQKFTPHMRTVVLSGGKDDRRKQAEDIEKAKASGWKIFTVSDEIDDTFKEV